MAVEQLSAADQLARLLPASAGLGPRCLPTCLAHSHPRCCPAQGLLFYCRRLGVVPRVKPLLWLAAALYAVGLYSEAGYCSHCPLRLSLLCLLCPGPSKAWEWLAPAMQIWQPPLHHGGTRFEPHSSTSPLQIQFYNHGMGLTPAESRFRVAAAATMAAAAALLLLGEHLK